MWRPLRKSTCSQMPKACRLGLPWSLSGRSPLALVHRHLCSAVLRLRMGRDGVVSFCDMLVLEHLMSSSKARSDVQIMGFELLSIALGIVVLVLCADIPAHPLFCKASAPLAGPLQAEAWSIGVIAPVLSMPREKVC